MTPPTESQRPHGIHRMAYGANAALMAAIAVAIVILLNYFFSQFNYRKDLTTGGVNALSPSTKAMLKILDQKAKGNFIIANLFDTKTKTGKAPTEQDKQQEEQARTVADLLREYQRSSRNITVIAPQSREDIEKLIKDRFIEENTRYENALKEIETFAGELSKFAKKEGDNFSTLAQNADQAGDEMELFASRVRGIFADSVPQILREANAAIADTRNQTFPRWDRVKSSIRTSLGRLVEGFKGMQALSAEIDPARIKDKTSKEIFEHFREIAPEVKTLVEKMEAYTKKLDDLPPSELSKIFLPQEPCLVILPPEAGPDAQKIKVLPKSEIFVTNRERRAGPEETAQFEGETLVSSSLLPFVQSEQKHVVFITAGPEQFLAQFREVRQRLEKLNFDVSTWAPPSPMAREPEAMPKQRPDHSGKGVIWVVVTPGLFPDRQFKRMESMGTAPVRTALEAHVADGGDVLYLANPGDESFINEAPATAPAAEGDSTVKPKRKFIYADLVEPMGVRVVPEYVVVNSTEIEARTGAKSSFTFGLVTTEQYPPHAITQSLQSLRSGFGYPSPSEDLERSLLTALVEPVPGHGGGASFVSIPAVSRTYIFTGDWQQGTVWATSKNPLTIKDLPDPKNPGPKPPLSVAACGERQLNGRPQRVAVFGNTTFAIDGIVQATEYVQSGNRVVRNPLLPANGELFSNAVLWLAGYENMIAVSAKAGTAGRIRPIEPGTLRAIQWGLLWIGLPAAALVAGATIFAVRRRA